MDAFAALVPAEVLTARGLILAVVTQKAEDGSMKVTDPVTLQWSQTHTHPVDHAVPVGQSDHATEGMAVHHSHSEGR